MTGLHIVYSSGKKTHIILFQYSYLMSNVIKNSLGLYPNLHENYEN